MRPNTGYPGAMPADLKAGGGGHRCGEGLVGQFKGGWIGRGYAQCIPDTLERMISEGKCDPRRIECQHPFTMRATATAAGATLNFLITPVGDAFLRELRLVRVVPTAPATLAEFVITQIQAAGRTAFTGTVTSGNAGTAAAAIGLDVGALGGGFQNYVVPNGVFFSSNNPLTITVVNTNATGADVLILAGFYDLVRLG